MPRAVTLVALLLLLAAPSRAQRAPDALMIAGEVTQSSAILQGRLSSGTTLVDHDLPGRAGWARWEVSADRSFRNPLRTDWARADAAGDFLVKNVVAGLKPGTRYHYRLLSGPTRETARPGRVGTFRTLPPADAAVPFGFVMLSCMDYEKFHGLARLEVRADWIQPATGEDKRLGYPALDQIRRLRPGFVIGNGDNVYYDRATPIATTREEMRAKWHRLFAMPRMRALTDSIATFWLKDDHDYRYNDADTLDAGKAPSHRLGVALFREQLPIVPPGDAAAPTYRTYRVNRDLQVWFLEGRDHRSPNALPDDARKTLWGAEQKAWLKRTLEESDATFRVVVSPTPLVGPDDAYKRDNHVNIGGFSTEGAEFMRWLGERGLMDRVFIMNGDRHWQYHSIHPSGLEEFGSGSVISQNSRFGRAPGDSASTDPEGRIRQPYIQTHPIGGFLHVEVDPRGVTNRPSILFTFRDEAGEVLYAARRYAQRTPAAAAALRSGEQSAESDRPRRGIDGRVAAGRAPATRP